MLASLQPYIEDSEDSANLFATELQEHLDHQFSFLLHQANAHFKPIYWAGTFLSPVHRQILSGDEIEVVRKYLLSSNES